MLNESIHFSKPVARNNANHYYSKQTANIQLKYVSKLENKETVFYLFPG